MIRTLLVLLALAGTAMPCGAQIRWYAGIGGGQARADRELVTNRETTLEPATDIRTDFDATDRAWKAFAGVQLNPVFAVELGYADLGSHRMTTRMLNAGLPAQIVIDRKLKGYGIDVLARPPLPWERLSLFARAGMFRTDLDATARLAGNIEFTGFTLEERRFRRAKQHENVFKLGVGADWSVTPGIAVRLEFERYHEVGVRFRMGGTGTTGEGDLDTVSLAVLMRF